MKLHGRITVFGEYLLNENLSYCLSIKSKLFLSNDNRDSKFVHPYYQPGKDKTIELLKNFGIKQFGDIYGNLPLGYGLSSSTILSLLHLNSADRKDLVEMIDREMSGFAPSGLDYTSIISQENGVFGFGKWIPIHDFYPNYSLIIVPKEKKKKLTDVKQKLATSQVEQIRLTKDLFSELNSKNTLNRELFYHYCKHLFSCNIYSESASEIVFWLLERNIAAKCIGGFYDKAILIIHSSKNEKLAYSNLILKTFDFATLIE